MKMKEILQPALYLLMFGFILLHSCDKNEPTDSNHDPICTIISPSADSEIVLGKTVTIYAEAEDQDNNLQEVHFYINGNSVDSSIQFPHRYEWETTDISEGSYTIKVIAYDKELAESEDEIHVNLVSNGDIPVAEFSADTTLIEEQTSIQFTDKSLGEPFKWEWDFGDGSTSSVKNPVHTFVEKGNYTVALTVTNEVGSNKETKIDYVSVKSNTLLPLADFIADKTSLKEGEMVEFTDQSSKTIISWIWDFGDDSMSSQQSPTHKYSSPGYYTVKLTVENEFGSRTETKTDYIKVNSLNGSPIDFKWVNVAAGSFLMGAISKAPIDEYPIHEVFVNSFEITKYEIVNAQYVEFLNDIGCNSDGSYDDDEYGNVEYIEISSNSPIVFNNQKFEVSNGFDEHPALVSWFGANAFAEWAGGRLPTEAEWEFAARGGNESEGYKYSGSDKISDVGWYQYIANSTKVVGQKQPNELGIYDMSGNASEWCNDWYKWDYYSESPQNNPQGPSDGNQRVHRGGNYWNTATQCRVSDREEMGPGTRSFGFRIVR